MSTRALESPPSSASSSKRFVPVSASNNATISRPVWSALAFGSMPSSFVSSAAVKGLATISGLPLVPWPDKVASDDTVVNPPPPPPLEPAKVSTAALKTLGRTVRSAVTVPASSSACVAGGGFISAPIVIPARASAFNLDQLVTYGSGSFAFQRTILSIAPMDEPSSTSVIVRFTSVITVPFYPTL